MSRALWAIWAVLVIGTAYRMWPVVAGDPALSEFFMTEDGYLMLTVARNMAIGLGMSVSDGTIPTNGVQPMAAFLFTLPYLATGGDKLTSLIGIHLIHTVTALAAAFAIRGLAARVLAPRDPGAIWPWAVAGLWFVSPVLLRHSMNGLETGLYTLVVVITLLVFIRVLDRGTGGLWLGALCGLTVLARNDAVFLVAAIFAVWAADQLFRHRAGVGGMIARLFPPGVVSLIVAAPWLINNQLRFGSIVPVSGPAQSLGAEFGQNAPFLPAKLVEYVLPMLPVPRRLETTDLAVPAFAVVVAVVLAIFLWRLARHTPAPARGAVIALMLHGAAISVYYGFFFGAAHFLSRYLAPLAPVLILAGLVTAMELGRLLVRARPTLLAGLYAGGGTALSLALLIYALGPGRLPQGHIQVVDWVEANVPATVWVGAVQTGTLGYWHDRTINLDGKVNPQALEARKTEGHVLNYVTGSDIDYVADWAGVGGWVDFPNAQGGFAEAFELIVMDPRANLSVMARKEPRGR